MEKKYLEDDGKKENIKAGKIKGMIKNFFLFIALVIVTTSYSDDFENFIVGIALAILIVFVWKKLSDRFLNSNHNNTFQSQMEKAHHESQEDDILYLLDNKEEEDELYEEAKKIVIEACSATTSLLQRRLRIGYARAAHLLDMLEDRGVISEPEGEKPRKILIK